VERHELGRQRDEAEREQREITHQRAHRRKRTAGPVSRDRSPAVLLA